MLEQFNTIRAQIEDARDEEQEYFDNMPESRQTGDKGTKAEEAISAFDEALNSLDEAISSLETAQE